MPSIKSTFVDGSSSFGGARGSVSAEARNERKAILLRSMDRYFLGVIFVSVILLIVAFALGTPGLKQAASTETVVPRITRGVGFR